MEKGKKQAQVFHFDLYGKRNEKYDFLQNNTLQSVQWQELEFNDENYFFVPKDFSLKEEYEKSFKIDELFTVNTSGVKTHNDNELIDFKSFNTEFNQKISYRPFDMRFINYDLKKVVRPRFQVMQHFLKEGNIGLCICRQQGTFDFRHILVTNCIADINNVSLQSKEITYVFPLYLYETFTNSQKTDDTIIVETVNLNKAVADKISEATGLQFMQLSTEILDFNAFAGEVYVKTEHTEKLFDYIYAVLHSPAYRERYKEFLKIDFPRVPYPENAEQFWKLAALGGKLRRLHLMEDVEPQSGMADFPIAGSNEVEKPEYVDGKVYINDSQFFENVPLVAWNFYIGGYQPAQKWLKDRKGRTLGYDDILHYQRVIRVLEETGEVMREVDNNN